MSDVPVDLTAQVAEAIYDRHMGQLAERKGSHAAPLWRSLTAEEQRHIVELAEAALAPVLPLLESRDALLARAREALDSVRECAGCGLCAGAARSALSDIEAVLGGDPRVARALPEMHNPDHVEPFDAFVRAMADELRANAHKGDRPAWLGCDPRVLVSEVLYHAAKLSYALRQYAQGDGPPERVVEFAADTANMAMMVADAAGVLVPGEAALGQEARDDG